MFDRKIIAFNDHLYEIVKVLKDKENFPIEDFKVYFDCEVCLRKEGYLYFCQQLQEIEVIEHTSNGEVQLVEKVQEESTTPKKKRTKG
jgi:hypothetical protein